MRGREGTALMEAVIAPEFVKAFNAEALTAGRYVNRLVQRLGATAELQRMNERVALCSAAVNGAASALVLWLGGSAVLEGRLSIGGFTGFLTLESMLHAPLDSVVRSLFDLIYARGILERVDDVLETAPQKRGTKAPPDLRYAAIELDHLTFRYGPSGPPLVDDVTLTIAPGEKVAIVGPSGAGKSTLSRLILGLLTPTEGAVRVGGVDVRELDPALYLRELGVVLQEPFFFDDTVRDNLAVFDPDVPLAQLKRAARLARIHDVIEALPLGYDTPLGPNAARLSGGQKQRLALARALVREPKLVVLDEATSSLDADCERVVHQNLAELACTRVVIAHRLATVRDADRVLVFAEGKFVQSGTYAELASQPGLFRSMVEQLV
jgi:ABC-type bacteriocin/lantibiotic exporter with double-glycine peptidase domain